MKKLLAAAAIVSVLAVGALAFAHAPGWGGGGYMMNPGYVGGHMMGQGHGSGYMMGRGGPGYGADQNFLEETADLRKELHNKRFEYFEASRHPEVTKETLAKLEKEIYDIQVKIREKAPPTTGGYGGYGHCW